MIMEKKPFPLVIRRKIIGLGNSSAITLPPDWVESRGIKIGDEVVIVVDNDLSISKVTKEKADDLHKRLEK